MNTRRQFLIRAPLGLAAAAAACSGTSSTPEQSGTALPQPATPGAPPAFGTAAGVGPAITPSTFAEAEKLAWVSMTDPQRQVAASSWRGTLAPYLERRTGPRKVAIEPQHLPAMVWYPSAIAGTTGPTRDDFALAASPTPPLPAKDDDI